MTVADRLFQVGPFVLSAGVLVFPLAFLIGDILTEVYGYAESRRVIWAGLAAELLLASAYTLAILLPAPYFFQLTDSFAAVLGQAPRIVLASVIAYWVGEFLNSYVLAKMKVRTSGEGMGQRFIASTAVGQAGDSLCFYPIAFLFVFPIEEVAKLVVSTWMFKVAWEVIVLPASLPIVRFVKRFEQVDVYDKDTKFTPFTLGG